MMIGTQQLVFQMSMIVRAISVALGANDGEADRTEASTRKAKVAYL